MKKILSKITVITLTVILLVGCNIIPIKPDEGPDKPEKTADSLNWLVQPEKAFEDVQALGFYCETDQLQSHYLIYQSEGKWGVINDELDIIVEASCSRPLYFCAGGTHLHVDEMDNNYIMPPILTADGLEIGSIGHTMGGEPWVIYNTNDGIFYVVLNDYGLSVTPLSGYEYGLSGIIPFEYGNLDIDDMGGIPWDYESEYKYGYCDNYCNILTQQKYDYAQSFYCGAAAVMQGDQWGYINESFQQITEFIYEPCFDRKYNRNEEKSPFFAYAMCDGYAPVMVNNKYGVIDKNGKEILPCAYDKIVPLAGGRALIKLEGNWGIADLK